MGSHCRSIRKFSDQISDRQSSRVLTNISEQRNACHFRLIKSFLSKIFLFLDNRLMVLRYMCVPCLWGEIKNRFWTQHSLGEASMLMGKNRTRQEMLNALTSSSFLVNFCAPRCGSQDNGLSFEINAFWLIRQVQCANLSKTHPSLQHQTSTGSSTPALMQLQLLRGIGSLNLLKPTNTWYVNDYFL